MKKYFIVLKFILIFIIVFAIAFLVYNSIDESDKWLNNELFSGKLSNYKIRGINNLFK